MFITEWQVQLRWVGEVVVARWVRRISRLLASLWVRDEWRFKGFLDFSFFS